jgi:hypothetical protein
LNAIRGAHLYSNIMLIGVDKERGELTGYFEREALDANINPPQSICRLSSSNIHV